ncbi:hypothetical protein BH20ACI4_BH20ACI4_13900 [soil metagenome]
MKGKSFIAVFIILFCSMIIFGQEKPSWIISFENNIKQKEANLEIGKTGGVSLEGGFFNYFYRMTSGIDRITILIRKDHDTPNRNKNASEKLFANSATLFERTINRNVERKKLENLGDEGFIWTNFNKEGWTRIHFRKQDVFVEISASSEETARRFSRYIVDEMP